MAKEDIFDKQSQIDALNVLEATRNQKTEEYVDRVNSRLSKRTKMTKGEMDMSLGHKRSYDEELPSTSSKKISTYENEEDITQEDTLSSVAESIWHDRDPETDYYIIDLGDEETLNQVHELLSDYELNSLFERLRLTDEDEYEKSCDNGDIEGENKDITDEKDNEEFAKMKGKVHQLDRQSEKLHYLSNTFPIPVESYDQSMPDIFVIKSVSSHLDTITKMNGIMGNTPERTWTAHVIAYLFFVTFCFIDSLRYFSCERDISTKVDAQDNGYKADGVLKFFERPRQIPLSLLEVSEGPNNPDPNKINGDRKKLMNEGI
ncbi:18551_t:CDS:2 [Rhizophagus irregularis]|nr:18551_t:CDS:2 [Rhizophagus irregularis]